jgi:stage II sporulation protein D
LKFMMRGAALLLCLTVAFESRAAPPPLPERLKTAAQAALPDEADGAAVVDLSTGELVLAHHPQVLARAYPPGSVLKLVTAYAALSHDVDPSTVERCTGSATLLGDRYKCWDASGHGDVDLTRALALSCNLYFNRLGARLSPDAFLSSARALGLGRSTASGLAAEEPGALPSGLATKELITVAAGDGYQVSVTPLQLLQLAAAVAGRGQARPLTQTGAKSSRPGLSLGNAAAVDFLREAMRQAAETGTLGGTLLGTVDGAGKTGTARWEHGFKTHAWFIGFAPYASPRYAVVAFAHSGQGAVQAAQPGVSLLRTALGFEADPPAPAAAPGQLRIRVLERNRAQRAFLETEAGHLSCDGAALELTGARLEIDSGLIDLGKPNLRCRVLTAPGEGVSIEIDGKRRRYRGSVRATVKDGQLAFLNDVKLEDYLRGVVGGEQLAGLPEALKAQAVVSRTYALAGRGRHEAAGYDLCDLTHCQLYRGRDDERAESDLAVAATQHEVLRHSGTLEPTFFHSACGGATSSPADVFKEPFKQPGVLDVDARKKPLCAESPNSKWTWDVPRARLASALGVPAEGPAFEAARRDPQGRVLELKSFGVPLTGTAFQARVGRALGFETLKSMKVRVTEDGGVVRFQGDGLGHGVGMCQFGARELARQGRDYRAILHHYFPGGALGPSE